MATATQGAAFFDLDRTLLAGASGEVFSAAMQAGGPGQPVHPRRERCSTSCSTPSARPCRRWRSPARPSTLAKGTSRVRRCSRPPRRRRRSWSRWSSRLAAPLFAEHRAAGRPVVLATTTPLRPGQAARRPARPRRRGGHPLRRRTPTAPTTARSTGRSCGAPASWRPCATGPSATGSTWPTATPTATASTTRRCWPRSGTRSWSTPTRAWS